MRQFLTRLRYALAVVGALVVVLTLVSAIALPIWWIQAMRFPSLQILAVLALLVLRWPAHRRMRVVLLVNSALALGT
ncbi:hypothetical protein [Hymenobacter sp. GOD-10R]|uniref:hypothetical protein n=1 Tax=Hymenobacter sp. GOD-10R TaxID=3093922 RepID=UPI002D78D10F|nr:hypothetical protein [Hymenobacter sp. GOD-10R]WRQ31919.1 hypothetical protein SD425_29670 [Hymenobacter sp. GOD-10R]